MLSIHTKEVLQVVSTYHMKGISQKGTHPQLRS